MPPVEVPLLPLFPEVLGKLYSWTPCAWAPITLAASKNADSERRMVRERYMVRECWPRGRNNGFIALKFPPTRNLKDVKRAHRYQGWMDIKAICLAG